MVILGRALRQALDRKVKKLKAMQSANEDITIVLEKVVCRLMKLTLRTFKAEESPPPTRWMLCKLLDLLTLTERAIARRNKHFIENFKFEKIVSAQEKETNRKIQEFEEKNPSKIQLDDYELDITGNSGEDTFLIESVSSSPSTSQNELDMVDTFFNKNNIFEEIKLEDLNLSPKTISQENTQGLPRHSPIHDSQKYEMVAYHCSKERATLRTSTFCTSAVRYKCKKVRARISKDRLVYEKDNCKPEAKNYRRADSAKKLSSPTASGGLLKTNISPTKVSSKGLYKTKAIIDDYGKIKLKPKASPKVHKKLQSNVSKPIPGSIIELCHPELTDQKNKETFRKSYSHSPIAATQRCQKIEIVTESGHQTIAMQRSTGTNPERIDEDEEYETVVNVTKNDSVSNGLQFRIDDEQTIFLNDINEPSTSKGVRHVSMDVQCSPINTAHVLSPATSYTTKLPDLFSVSLKIEDSLNNLTTKKNLSFGHSVECDEKCMEIVNQRLNSSDKTKSRGITIEDSASNLVMERTESKTFENFNRNFGSISPIIRSPSTSEINEPRIYERKRSSSHTDILLNHDQTQNEIFDISIGENKINEVTSEKRDFLFSKTLSIRDSVKNITVTHCSEFSNDYIVNMQSNCELREVEADKFKMQIEKSKELYKKRLIEEFSCKSICHSRSLSDGCKDIKLWKNEIESDTTNKSNSIRAVSELNAPTMYLKTKPTLERKTVELSLEVISSNENNDSAFSTTVSAENESTKISAITLCNHKHENKTEQVDKSSETPSYLSLSCGGIQIHSRKDKNGIEDIIFKGMWEHRNCRSNKCSTVYLPGVTSSKKLNTFKDIQRKNSTQTKGMKEMKSFAKKDNSKPSDIKKSDFSKAQNIRNTKLSSEKKNKISVKVKSTSVVENTKTDVVKVASRIRTNVATQRSKIPRYIKIRTRSSKQLIAGKDKNDGHNANSLKKYLPTYLIRRKNIAAQKSKQNLLQASKVELKKVEDKTDFIHIKEVAAQDNLKKEPVNRSISSVSYNGTIIDLNVNNVISARIENSESIEGTESKINSSALNKNKLNHLRKKIDSGRKSVRNLDYSSEKNKENILSSSNNLTKKKNENKKINMILTGTKQKIFLAHLPENSVNVNNIAKSKPHSSSISKVISTSAYDTDEIKKSSSNACTSSNNAGSNKEGSCNAILNEVLNDILDTSNNVKITPENADSSKHVEKDNVLVDTNLNSFEKDSLKLDETSSLVSFKTVITNDSSSCAELEDAINHTIDEFADDSLPSFYGDMNTTSDIQSNNFNIEHVENINQQQPQQRINSNSVRNIYEGNSLRRTQNPQTTLASQVMSGFSVNESLVAGDYQPRLIRLVDSETGSYTVVERVRQATSEEVYISGIDDSDSFVNLNEDVVLPDWLFNILSHQESLIIENGPELQVNPLPALQEPLVMHGPEQLRDGNGNLMEPGVGAGAGAGDGHGMHSDNSEDSSGQGSSLSSSDASSRQQSESILFDPSALTMQYEILLENIPEASATRNVTRNVTAIHSYTRTDTRVSSQMGNTPTEGPCHHHRMLLPPSDVEADVSSLDTDVPSDEN